MCEQYGLRGTPGRQPNLFVKINPEVLVPAEHPARAAAQGAGADEPVHGAECAGLRERIAFDMLFRWFLDMTPDERCFDHRDL